MRLNFLFFFAIVPLAACTDSQSHVSAIRRASIERTIENQVESAYDFSQPDVVDRLMALYATDTRILSASGGQVMESRDSLRMGIEAFWNNVGRNMRDPKVEWTLMRVEVLSPTAAVMTATYQIPHKQPNGLPHVIAGAWTAVFELRGGKWVITQEHLSDRPY